MHQALLDKLTHAGLRLSLSGDSIKAHSETGISQAQADWLKQNKAMLTEALTQQSMQEDAELLLFNMESNGIGLSREAKTLYIDPPSDYSDADRQALLLLLADNAALVWAAWGEWDGKPGKPKPEPENFTFWGHGRTGKDAELYGVPAAQLLQPGWAAQKHKRV